ncbi:MAG: FtsX-like permease family protein, partial [Bryobacteraceae bacterium]
DELPEPTIYVPISSGVLNFASLAVSTKVDPLSLAIPIEQEIAGLDPNLAVSHVLTMDQLISKRTADRHFILMLLMSFAGLAVLLAAVGLYGVISYATGQRISEFGLRLALGAQPSDLIRSVLWAGLSPALTGMAIGFAGALAAVRLMQSLLFGVKPFDTSVFVSVVAGLFVVSPVASAIPALRAAKIDPAQALRTE